MICCGIYKFTERDTGKVYIGQSKDIYGRYGLHYFHATNKKYEQLSPIDQALFHNPMGFDFEIIELCEEHELNAKENYWIEYYNSKEKGFNVFSQQKIYQFTKNGELVNVYNGYSEAARAIGKVDGKANIYHCCKGTIKTAYGYRWSYFSDLNKEQKAPELSKQKNQGHSTKKREVLQLTTDGKLVQKYTSCADAARAVGVTSSAITHVCNGRGKTCKGFVWKYNEENWEQQ